MFKQKHKILMIDGIPQWPMGVEFYQALKGRWPETFYLNQSSFDRKNFYGIRRSVAKLVDKKPKAYVHPLLPKAQVKQKLEEIKPTIVLIIGFVHHLIDKDFLKSLKQHYGFQLILWDTDSANYGQSAQLFKEFLHDEIMRYDRVFSFSSAMTHAPPAHSTFAKLILSPQSPLYTGAIQFHRA